MIPTGDFSGAFWVLPYMYTDVNAKKSEEEKKAEVLLDSRALGRLPREDFTLIQGLPHGPMRFTLGDRDLTYGLDLTLQRMKRGEVAKIFLDPPLAYGKHGVPGMLPIGLGILFFMLSIGSAVEIHHCTVTDNLAWDCRITNATYSDVQAVDEDLLKDDDKCVPIPTVKLLLDGRYIGVRIRGLWDRFQARIERFDQNMAAANLALIMPLLLMGSLPLVVCNEHLSCSSNQVLKSDLEHCVEDGSSQQCRLTTSLEATLDHLGATVCLDLVNTAKPNQTISRLQVQYLSASWAIRGDVKRGEGLGPQSEDRKHSEKPCSLPGSRRQGMVDTLPPGRRIPPGHFNQPGRRGALRCRTESPRKCGKHILVIHGREHNVTIDRECHIWDLTLRRPPTPTLIPLTTRTPRPAPNREGLNTWPIIGAIIGLTTVVGVVLTVRRKCPTPQGRRPLAGENHEEEPPIYLGDNV
ncbi:unnamed protein product [Cyprideis torosa]|uniref:peptidylprolyl isomerase n=1 Tax=Cyprideis torosa TaxID=163714 RepID=A0A7R8ZJP1_9CRUS|nr:unnamed protein product [Cyprideis torosa]CAG0879998.1 unnamed protein product [Cyprideis torosa]